jgi:enoyl-CoA hydratase
MNGFESYETIAAARDGRILTLTINRPDVLNAVNARMHYELSRLFYDVAADEETDIVILTGAGRAFCAGGDLDWLQAAADDPQLFARIAVEAKQIIYGMLDCEKPILCRLNGDAIGLGATMVLFSDMIVAAETARIGDLHVNVGLVAGDGGAIIWPQLIGYPRAKEFLMTGRIIDGRQAAEMGLVNYAVPAEELDAKTDELARRLNRGSTMAVRLTKSAINVGLKQLAHGMMDASIAYETLTNTMPDHQDGLAAFREKRKPNFGGG